MPYKEQISRFCALDKWFISPLGMNVAKAFDLELSHIKQLLHGNIMLQLGSCGDNLWYHNLRFQRKWMVTPQNNASKSLFLSMLDKLPLDRDSVDCVIAPLTIEAFAPQSNLLDEIDRILKPMGYVVFLGINPLSLWGAWLRYSNRACFGPLNGHPRSSLSVKRAMMHRGYHLCHFNVFHYIPPINSNRVQANLEILNEIGKMISLMPAGFYCLVMQKYVENPPTPLLASIHETMAELSPVNLRPICHQDHAE